MFGVYHRFIFLLVVCILTRLMSSSRDGTTRENLSILLDVLVCSIAVYFKSCEVNQR